MTVYRIRLGRTLYGPYYTLEGARRACRRFGISEDAIVEVEE